jgi:ABC-type protease/lipase transport system fused ATPase/permease subunit
MQRLFEISFLSAVDQHVGNALFNKLIRGLLREKAIVLVTNQIQYLPQCDKILLLKNGMMAVNCFILVVLF